jgi:hypothetical protein
MRPPTTRKGKRKRLPEQVPSAMSLEVISLVRQGDHVSKKRIIEATPFDLRASPTSFPAGDIHFTSSSHPSASGSHPSESFEEPDVFEQLFTDPTGRSVSVSDLNHCHVITRSPFLLPSRPWCIYGSPSEFRSSMNSFVWKRLRLRPPLVLSLHFGTFLALRVEHLRRIVV